MVVTRSAVVVGALVVTAATGAVALASGCTVLTNDAPPDDAGLFEGGDAKTSSCDVCLSFYCAAPQALCLTDPACTGVLACATASSCDTTCQTGCACTATSDGGPSPDRLYHAYTSCNDARIGTCANDCAVLHRSPSTLGPCTEPEDAGASDAAIPGTDASASDGGPDDGGLDAGATDAAIPGTDACIACAAASCSAAVSACASGTECGAFLACASACTTASCAEDCATQHATGKVAATELATCTIGNCQKSCEL